MAPMGDDNAQHNLACGGSRFVEDVRVLEDGRVEARVWSLSWQQPV
jgi:hypothetical protein